MQTESFYLMSQGIAFGSFAYDTQGPFGMVLLNRRPCLQQEIKSFLLMQTANRQKAQFLRFHRDFLAIQATNIRDADDIGTPGFAPCCFVALGQHHQALQGPYGMHQLPRTDASDE